MSGTLLSAKRQYLLLVFICLGSKVLSPSSLSLWNPYIMSYCLAISSYLETHVSIALSTVAAEVECYGNKLTAQE